MKRMIYVFICVLALTMLCACGKKNNKNSVDKKAKKTTIEMTSKKMKDDLIVVCENYNWYKAKGMGVNGFEFEILSKDEIKSEEIKMNIDTTLKYTFELERVTDNDISFKTFQMYNGYDWKKLNQLRESKTTDEYEKYKDMYRDNYNNMDKNVQFKVYTASVFFDSDSITDNSVINKMNVQYKGKTYDIDCNINIYNDLPGMPEDEGNYDFETLSPEAIFSSNVDAVPNAEGKLLSDEYNFDVNEDLKITDIDILGTDSAKLDDVNISVDGIKKYDQKWQGELSLVKGDKVKIKINIKDTNFCNKLVYATKVRPIITYEVNGVKKRVYYEVDFRTHIPADQLYAYYIDKIDVLSYYTEFYSKTYFENN